MPDTGVLASTWLPAPGVYVNRPSSSAIVPDGPARRNPAIRLITGDKATPEEYLKMGQEHTGKDQEISWEESQEMEKT